MRSVLAAVAALTLSLPAASASPVNANADKSAFTSEQLAEFGPIITAWIAAHPEEVLKALETAGTALQIQADDWVTGNPSGDVTVALFVDRLAAAGRNAIPEVAAIAATDPDVKLVIRELPQPTDLSVSLAEAAVAARRQGERAGKLFELSLIQHQGTPDEAAIMAAAKLAQLDMKKFAADRADPEIGTYLGHVREFAAGIGIRNAPTLLVGKQVFINLPPTDELRSAILKERGK
jgi:protein-disulfide isomerase